MSCGIKRIIKLSEAITAQPIKLYFEKLDITPTCMFSWSTDGVCWSSWADYTNYLKITPLLESDFYLRILINTGLSKIVLGECVITDYSISKAFFSVM